MFYFVSKLFFQLARPLHFLIILMLLGLGLQITPARRLGLWLVNGAVVILILIAMSPLAFWITIPLEERFPRIDHVDVPPDGIIVLGGAIENIPEYGRPHLISLNDAAERLTEIPRLAQLYPKARIIYTGGPVYEGGGILSEAAGARELFIEWGTSPDRITIEDQSLTTWENAVLTKEIVHPALGTHWLLVTSAFHMPRAVGVFRKAGWPGIVAYPTDYRAPNPAFGVGWRAVASDNLELLELSVKEYFGLLGYWLGGRSSAVFPGPETP
jgi:uncharacterized SAM-binding protein YcdF (DUF218 family)